MSHAERSEEGQYVQDNAPKQFDEICVALKQVFTVPFRDFSIAWEDNVFVPSADAEVRQMVAAKLENFPTSLRKEVITKVMTFLDETFIVLRVKTFLIGEPDDEEFLNLFSAFIDYYEQACSVVHEMFASLDTSELQIELGNRTVYKYLRYYGLRTLYSELKARLQTASLDRVRKVRENFRYTSKLAYEALASPSVAKVTSGFQEFFPTEEYHDCMSEFRQDAVERVKIMLETKFLHGMQGDQKRFLVTLKSCVETERIIFKWLYRPTPAQVQEYSQELNTAFCVVHLRREQAGLFEDYIKFLISPEAHFDPAILLGLMNMYAASEEEKGQNFESKLVSTVRDLFKRIFRQNAPDHSLGNTLDRPMESFRRCLEYMAQRDIVIKSRISSISHTAMREGLTKLYNAGCTELWNDGYMELVDEYNIDDAQRSAIKYICSQDSGVENEVDRLRLIEIFFQFVADRGVFMEKLFEKMQRAYLNMEKINVNRLITFRELPEVSAFVPDNINTFITDVTESDINDQIIGEQIRNCGSHIKHGSSLVFKERDWKALKDMENLLTIPKELIPMRNRVETRMKELYEPEKEIRPLNALARVTIRTTLFTPRYRQFTRINLLLYQAMVLNLFESKHIMRVREIYEALISGDIPADSERRKTAEDIVNRLIESLRESNLLLVTQFDATDLNPSTNVYLNRNFFFNEEEATLKGQTILGENPQYFE